MNTRKRIIGIDFSGAQSAGKAIWIAEAHATPAGVRITSLQSVADRLGETNREPALAALRGFIAKARSSVIGIDAPFSLPKELIDESDWRSWALSYADRHESADAMRRACLERTGGKEHKRATDREARTPFSAYNLRLYKQTHHLLADVIAPLIANENACALPMQHTRDDLPNDTPWLLETCPASTLKALARDRNDFNPASYKGTKPEHETRRRDIVERLERERLVEWSTGMSDIATEDRGGDALDASLCALAARRALARPDALHCEPGSPEAIEGHVYV
jgi:hypothetical protein